MAWQRLSDSFSWSRGHSGKGYLLRDGTIKTWNSDPFHPVEHSDIHEGDGEISPIALKFEIDPDGGIVTDSPSTKVEAIVAADSRLYDAGQRPVFEDDWDLENYEPKEETAGKPDLNFVMSGAEDWEPETTEQFECPRCHRLGIDDVGRCRGCGYTIPYDGWEQMQGGGEGDPVPGWKAGLDDDDLPRELLGEPRFGAWHLADGPYGYTNWDTSSTILMIDNDSDLYQASRALMEKGATPEQLRDWAVRKVIGPYNREQMKDAKEWNAIPLEERQRRIRQRDIEQYGEAAVNMGEGLMQPFKDMENEGKSEEEIQRDEEYDAPDLIDPEMVNWDEIHQQLVSEAQENESYDREIQDWTDQGIGWPTNHDEATNRMRDALYRYHGAMPEEDIQAELGPGYHGRDPRQYHNRKVNLPLEQFSQWPGWPDNFIPGGRSDETPDLWGHRYWRARAKAEAELLKGNPHLTPEQLDGLLDSRGFMARDYIKPHFPGGKYDTPYQLDDPEERALLEQSPIYQNWAQNGYDMSLSDFSSDLSQAVKGGQPHPYIDQMREALQQRGYTPEQIAQIMQPQWQWDEQLQQRIPVNQAPPVQQWEDQSMDQPGNTFVPQEWTSHVANSTGSWHYNTWTGKPCHCPWHGSHRKLQKQAGQHLNKLLKAPDKAYKTPEGQRLLAALKEMPEEYESLYPYLAHRFKKGDVRPGEHAGLEYNTHLDPWNGTIPAHAYWPYLANNDLHRWHQWYEARQHPTRRGIDVFHKDFTMGSLQARSNDHQQALQDRRQLQNALGHGETEMTFPNGWSVKHLTSRQNDTGDWNEPGEALRAEGQLMGHCIGSDEQPYVGAAESGMIGVYSLRDKQGRPHATWHYNSDGSLAEMFGPNDDQIKPQYQQMIDAWGEKTANDTDPNRAVGNAEGGHDESFTFPEATDMDDYVNYHHPDYMYEYANEYGDIGDGTELDWEAPDWESIAEDYAAHGGTRNFEEAIEHNSHRGYLENALAQLQEPSYTFQRPNDVDDYIKTHHPEMFEETAREDNPQVGENTELNWEDPHWPDMARSYLAGDLEAYDHSFEDFTHALAGHPEAHYRNHVVPFAQAVEQEQPEDEDEARRMQQWQDYIKPYYHPYTGELSKNPVMFDYQQPLFGQPGAMGVGQSPVPEVLPPYQAPYPPQQTFSAYEMIAPTTELREWLADLGGEEPPSIHHDSEDDFISSPAVSTANDLPYFPPANVPKEYKQGAMTVQRQHGDTLRMMQAGTKTADSPINQADATNDPLGKNPAIIPSRQGDPDYLQPEPCPHCSQRHRADEPCPDSSLAQYKQMERQWAAQDPNAVSAPDGLGQHQLDLSKTTAWDFEAEGEGDMSRPNAQRYIGWVPANALEPEFDRRDVHKGDPAKVDAVKQDLLKRGFLNPVWVDYHPDTKMAYFSEGNHRVTAARELGIPVPATVMRSMRTPKDQSVLRGPFEYTGNEADVISGDPPQYMHPRDIGLPEAEPFTPGTGEFLASVKAAADFTYYHAAPGIYHDQISAEGLRGHEPEIQGQYSPWEWTDDPAPDRHPVSNYLWKDPEHAWQYAHDERLMDPIIYAVDASGLPVSPDPDEIHANQGAVHVPLHIPPERLTMTERPEGEGWDWSHLSKQASWDPLVCEHCNGPMTEPRKLGVQWVNNCTRCGLTRQIPSNYPLLQQQRQQEEMSPYPDLLKQVAQPRPWVVSAYDHEDSLIDTATALVDGGSDVSEAASWLEQALVQSGRSPQDAEMIADEVFMRREGSVEEWDEPEHRTASTKPDPLVEMKATLEKLTGEIAQMQKPSGVQPEAKKSRKLVIKRDEQGRMASIEEA